MGYKAPNVKITVKDVEEGGRGLLKVYPRICLGRLRKTTIYLSIICFLS
jgi:hypothetical protein